MIAIRKFRKDDTKEVALLVMRTWARFNHSECIRKSAFQDYLDYYDPQKNTVAGVYEKFQRTPIFYVATAKNKIIGMIRGRPERIGGLFVDGSQHGKGIGRALMSRFEAEARKRKSGEIKVRSSLYAAPFYQALGYRKTTGIRNFRGLKVYPMRKDLRRQKA